MSAPTGPGRDPGQTQPQPRPGEPGYGGTEPGYGGERGYPGGERGYPGGERGYPGTQPGYGGGQGGPGMGERFSQAGDVVARHVKTPETKEFFKTSEFVVWALTAIGILIAAAVVTEGAGSDFPAVRAWLYVAIISAAYIVSRGIAKAGTRRGYGDAPFDDDRSRTPFQRGSGY